MTCNRFVYGLLLCAGSLLLPGADAEDFSIVVLPDTQNYSTAFPEIYAAQTDWIRTNAVSRNIRCVLHVGDIVNNDTVGEWSNAKAAMTNIDGVVSYIFAMGNHDFPGGNYASGSLFNDSAYFGPGPGSGYATQPTLELFDTNRTDVGYLTFKVGSSDWLAMGLPWGETAAIRTWADGVLSNHPNHIALISYHYYLDGSAQQRSSPGQTLWDEVLKKHENVLMVFCGHVLAAGADYPSQGVHSNTVYQMLSNYQGEPNGGNGWLRILDIDADGTVDVTTYSPTLQQFKTDDQNQFSFAFTNSFTQERSVAFDVAGTAEEESSTTVVVGVSLSHQAISNIVVEYTVSGTASNAVDFALAGGSLFFPVGVTATNISFPVFADSDDEFDETVVLTLRNPSNAVLGATTQYVYTIVNDDFDMTLRSRKMEICLPGYDCAVPLTNFPVLVVLGGGLGPAFAYDQFAAPATGGDLRFVDQSETNELPFEIELWDTNGASFVWVRVPLVTSNTCFWASWGYAGHTNLPGYTGDGSVWSELFDGVWHLGATNSGGGFSDSVADGHDGVDSGSSNAVGAVGFGRSFDSGEFIELGTGMSSAVSLELPVTGVTASAWIRPESFVELAAAVSFVRNDVFIQSGWAIGTRAAGNFYVTMTSWPFSTTVDSPATYATGNWYLVTGTYDGSVTRLYVNGRQVATSTAEIGEVYYRDTWYRLGMLKDVNEAISIDGIVDEARVSALARSSNWVWACWMNQTRQTGFPLYGPITEPFVDVDVDDIPDTWEVEHFGSITNVSRTSDHDGDGFLDWREERAGTSPTDASSLLRFVSAKAQRTSTNVVVRWSSESNRFYAINVSSSLSSPWTRLTNHLPATPPMNTYTVNQAGVPEQFFVIEVE